MAYREEEKTRLKRQSSKLAISLAMEGRWKEAIEANQSLVDSFPNDVDAYNRLGRAHMELGEYSLARQAYSKSLEIDPYNIIAQKNVNRLSHLGETTIEAGGEATRVDPQQFIEEVGKAGVVGLLRLGSSEVLAKTVAGAKVTLKVDGQRLTVENLKGEYLGQVEPRHSQRLIKLMEGGNQYSAAVVSANENSVTVIIKETFQHASQIGQMSFPSRGPGGTRNYAGDRIGDMLIRRQLEYEEALPGESGYAIVDGEEVEYYSEDSGEDEDDEESEE